MKCKEIVPEFKDASNMYLKKLKCKYIFNIHIR